MKITVERHIKQGSNSYKVYTYNPEKSLADLFVFDESKGWLESTARLSAMALVEKLSKPVVESVTEIFNSDLVDTEVPYPGL